MLRQRTDLDLFCLAMCLSLATLIQPAQSQGARPFSVKDDVEITQFGDIYNVERGDVVLSPSGERVVVHTTEASLEDGMLHDQLRIYDVAQLRSFVNASDEAFRVEPLWTIGDLSASSGQGGPLVSRIRWLRDESGIAFLLRSDQHQRLFLATIAAKQVVPLSPELDDVLSFDIRDRSHYVFTLASRETKERLASEINAPFRVGTGQRLYDVMFPNLTSKFIGRGELWAAYGGPAEPVKDRATGKPIILYEDGSSVLSLSPTRASLVTIRPVAEVPEQWEVLFAAPFPNDAYQLRTGPQDLTASSGWSYVGEYVLIDLTNGGMTSLMNAPSSMRTGWWEANAAPAWSDDGSSILLPGTFDGNRHEAGQRPCTVVVGLASETAECVRRLKRNLAASFEPGYERIDEVSFATGQDDRVLLKSLHDDRGISTTRTYVRSNLGAWYPEETKPRIQNSKGFEVRVNATFTEPPVLVGSDSVSKKSRVILDPNPQLRNIAFGKAELYKWTDNAGHEWQGILYKPVGYDPGTRYPLVIENHGFSIDRFVPSGGFPSAFVAQELASAGIMVLHVRDCDGRSTESEGPCNVKEYEAAIASLSKQGLVDSSHVGLIGFSRTVYYVLEALTTSKIQFKAASITQGMTVGYMEYLSAIAPNDPYRREAERLIGSSPYGKGLTEWLKASPDFNMDKVITPLRIVATGNDGLPEMWEPYALLEAMHKPVDLIILNTSEHIVTDPSVRMAAQGGNVDWFRFWLQDYEDPDPAKKDQYDRWRRMRALDAEYARH